MLLGAREFTEVEKAYYRKPFVIPGEDRRPIGSFEFSVNDKPHMKALMNDYAEWLAESHVPKLYIQADPGYIGKGRLHEFCSKWHNQAQATVMGKHFVQETDPFGVGAAIAEFVQGLRHLSR